MTETVFDEIASMTTHIETEEGTGTGFFFRHDREGLNAFLLITNRHVLEGAENVELNISYGDPERPASPGRVRRLRLKDIQKTVIFHPEGLDIAVVPVMAAFEQMVAEGFPPRFRALGFKDFADDETEFGLAQDVLMIGYPRGIVDTYNNRPIVRRGITATSYSLDYEGKPEFVIDAACFPGSSGSPIMVANGDAYIANGNLMSGSRARFLGILWGGPTITATGELKPEPIPTAAKAIRTEVMMNLGFCIKARAIRAFLEGLLESAWPRKA